MKQILSGWWDQVRMREGWSHKIGKWQWVCLQIVIPIIIVSPFLAWIVVKFEDYTLKQAVIFVMIFFPFVALFNSNTWDKDQKVILNGGVHNEH